MAMGAAEVLLLLLVSAFVLPVGYVVLQAAHAVYREHHPYSPCSPQRYASLTASRPQRSTTGLGRISSPRAGRHLAAWAADYAVPRPVDVDAIRANSLSYDLASLTAPAVPELPPVVLVVEEDEQGIAVDWPTRVVQPVPLRR